MKQSKLIKILPEELCDELVSALQTSTEWKDGKETTGLYLKDKKTNLELKPDSETFAKVTEAFMQNFNGSPKVNELMVRRVIALIINRYSEGGKYGSHYDQEYMHD